MALRPQWEWRLADPAGPVQRPVSPVFANRYDAEQWLGEHWRALAGQGVTSAQLLNEGAAVGPAVALRAA
ncbi:hypothetical protein [Cellulomonas gilvus]|uniref:Uncharacterized protein n=1 Tax=Cellulomonas gilvus (strain ATCC 13127 / NRRL B-14078) TaxID=593907 RepID=F8A3M0_CELGA|nr:hypothetical protein [Cellulomonas gilvus]AEI11923.1 hypothetical protein Celgi_1404 [Cellulomonas gilvus ATCC 13127]